MQAETWRRAPPERRPPLIRTAELHRSTPPTHDSREIPTLRSASTASLLLRQRCPAKAVRPQEFSEMQFPHTCSPSPALTRLPIAVLPAARPPWREAARARSQWPVARLSSAFAVSCQPDRHRCEALGPRWRAASARIGPMRDDVSAVAPWLLAKRRRPWCVPELVAAFAVGLACGQACCVRYRLSARPCICTCTPWVCIQRHHRHSFPLGSNLQDPAGGRRGAPLARTYRNASSELTARCTKADNLAAGEIHVCR